MLSQGNTSASEPLYDYFLVEDDLDIAVDDQPIDFSKRYSDLNSGSKTVGKKRHRSTTASVNSEPIGCKQPCEDDVRVYCIEGTPLLTSSSSSMWDIRDCSSFETGLPRKSLDMKDRFRPTESSKNSPENSKEQTSMLKTNERPDAEENQNNELKIDPRGRTKATWRSRKNKISVCRKILVGDDLPSFRSEETNSELSSPHMFSRSSSVDSLNSSEQHSIVDDRSSVSIFSNLTSGIISPSELPDSPCEGMSPFIHKNRQVFKFPPDSEKHSDDKLALDMCNDAYNDAPEDVLKVYDIEGDCSSMSSFSELSIHTSSHMSVTYSNDFADNQQKITIKMDGVASSQELQNSNIDCSTVTEKPAPLSLEDKPVLSYHPKQFSCPAKEENNYLQVESHSLKEVSISSMDKNDADRINKEEDNDSDFSLIDSDGEAEALLEECIRSGKTPKSTPDVMKCKGVEKGEFNIEDVSSLTGIKSEDEADNLYNFDGKETEATHANKNESIFEVKKACESEIPGSYFSVIKSDCKVENLSEKFIKNKNSSKTMDDVKKDELLVEEKKPCEIETAESCNSLSDSDDEADALLEECIRNGKPDTEKCKKDIKLQPNKTENLNPREVLQSFAVRESASEKKNSAVPKLNMIQRPQKKYLSEKIKKTTKVHDPASYKYLKQKSANTSPNSKLKQEYHQGNSGSNAFQCCNSYQGRKCRFEQNVRSFHGMKPYRPEFLQERTSDPVKKLRNEIFIELYKTLNEDKPDRNSKSMNPEYDDDDMLVNQCIKLGMPNRSPRKHSSSLTQSPSKAGHVPLAFKSNDKHFIENASSPSRTNQMFSQSRTGTRPQEFFQSGMSPARLNQTQIQSRSRYTSPSFNNQFHPKRNQSMHTVRQIHKSYSKHIHQKLPKKEEFYNRIEEDYEETENDILQQCIQLGMPTKSRRQISETKDTRANSSYLRFHKNLGYRDNHRPDGISDGEDDDDILMACINAGKPKEKGQNKTVREQSSHNQTPILAPNKLVLQQQKACINNNIKLNEMHQSMPFTPSKSRWASPIVPDHGLVTPVEEAPCVYKTEDTPVLSPTASMSDLSCLSFHEDKSTCSNLNNSRNSDISSEFDDDDDEDELLLQCIQSGMPSADRAVA